MPLFSNKHLAFNFTTVLIAITLMGCENEGPTPPPPSPLIGKVTVQVHGIEYAPLIASFYNDSLGNVLIYGTPAGEDSLLLDSLVFLTFDAFRLSLTRETLDLHSIEELNNNHGLVVSQSPKDAQHDLILKRTSAADCQIVEVFCGEKSGLRTPVDASLEAFYIPDELMLNNDGRVLPVSIERIGNGKYRYCIPPLPEYQDWSDEMVCESVKQIIEALFPVCKIERIARTKFLCRIIESISRTDELCEYLAIVSEGTRSISGTIVFRDQVTGQEETFKATPLGLEQLSVTFDAPPIAAPALTSVFREGFDGNGMIVHGYFDIKEPPSGSEVWLELYREELGPPDPNNVFLKFPMVPGIDNRRYFSMPVRGCEFYKYQFSLIVLCGGGTFGINAGQGTIETSSLISSDGLIGTIEIIKGGDATFLVDGTVSFSGSGNSLSSPTAIHLINKQVSSEDIPGVYRILINSGSLRSTGRVQFSCGNLGNIRCSLTAIAEQSVKYQNQDGNWATECFIGEATIEFDDGEYEDRIKVSFKPNGEECSLVAEGEDVEPESGLIADFPFTIGGLEIVFR